MTDDLMRLQMKLKPIEAKISDRLEQKKSADEAEFVRCAKEEIENRKLREAAHRKALQQQNPKWRQLFEDSAWKSLESLRDEAQNRKAKACREWQDRAWHCLTPDEQKRVAEVQAPFDREIAEIERLMWRMQHAVGLTEVIDLTRHGKDISSLADLLEQVRSYRVAVEILETVGQGCDTSVAKNVNTYRQAAERLRLQQSGMSELLPKQDVSLEELHNLEVWAEVEIKKNSQQKHKGKPIGEVGSSNSIVGAGVESREINVTKPPFSDSKELNAVFADIEQCLQTLEVLSSNYNLLSSLERAGKVRDMVGSIDGMQFTSEDDRLAHDDAERQISAAANILYKPLTRVFAWGRDHRLDLPFDGSELTSQIPYSWWDEDENCGHYEYYAFICEQYQSELDLISKALAVVACKDSVAYIVLESYAFDPPVAIAEVTMLTLGERQIVLETLKKATTAYTRTFRILYEAHLLPADLILFQQRRDSLHGLFEGWKLCNYESEYDDTFNVMSNAEEFIRRVIAMRPSNIEKVQSPEQQRTHDDPMSGVVSKEVEADDSVAFTPPMESDSPKVVLGKPGTPCRVMNKEKPALTDAQYAVVNALLKAGENGLSKDALEAVRPSARRILNQLRKDPDWAVVILMAGQTNGRYRIKS